MSPTVLRRLAAAAGLVLALAGAPAQAGRSCEQRAPGADAVARSLALAERATARLDASGARVVVLARAGQDLSAHGLRYSHLGIAYREGEALDAPWRIVHKLNHCGSARATLYRQGLGDFFLDDLWRHEAAFVVLSPALQSSLLRLVADNPRVAALDEPAYSLVAYPWSVRYQQSNQWAIETLAAAMEPGTIRTRDQAQAWLQFKGYEPSTLKLGPLTRLGGRVGSANVAFDDHPNEKRFSDRIETVTVDSIFAWLPRAGLGAAPVTLKL